MTTTGRRRVAVALTAVAIVLALGGVVALTASTWTPWIVWCVSLCITLGNLDVAIEWRSRD